MTQDLWRIAGLAFLVASIPFLGMLKNAIVARIKWLLGRRY